MSTGFLCPSCEAPNTEVKDSRSREDGTIRRRRHCHGCGLRFTTFEIVQPEGMGEGSDAGRYVRSTALRQAFNSLSLQDQRLALQLVQRIAGQSAAELMSEAA